eukprot:TRINITY_DN33038_c0_g1_i1.p1 TRINITY_DN33038_c0_g1~~TRINITY_DN33038_c0_g1_i1.p1  ORF type:complete len:283 (-),score=78.47 TRINITY_DN33038_c0_g1_i1:228-1040(-)
MAKLLGSDGFPVAVDALQGLDTSFATCDLEASKSSAACQHQQQQRRRPRVSTAAAALMQAELLACCPRSCSKAAASWASRCEKKFSALSTWTAKIGRFTVERQAIQEELLSKGAASPAESVPVAIVEDRKNLSETRGHACRADLPVVAKFQKKQVTFGGTQTIEIEEFKEAAVLGQGSTASKLVECDVCCQIFSRGKEIRRADKETWLCRGCWQLGLRPDESLPAQAPADQNQALAAEWLRQQDDVALLRLIHDSCDAENCASQEASCEQ